MTTIAYKDHIFATDSYATGTDGSIKIHDDKVFVNGPITFAIAGRSRATTLLKYMKIPEMPISSPDWSLEKWINSVFILEIRKEFKAYGFDNDDGVIGGISAMIYLQGRCFQFDSDFHFQEITDEEFAVGSGRKFALGAMAFGATAKEAVKIAKKMDSGTGGKIHVFHLR